MAVKGRLSDADHSLIKGQLVEILEAMRLKGWEYVYGDPAKIFYDRDVGEIYLTGLTHAEPTKSDPSETKPITESSYVIWEFGLNVWRF